VLGLCEARMKQWDIKRGICEPRWLSVVKVKNEG
jgi:hypothetical protein